MKKKLIIGLVENVVLDDGTTHLSKVDTGADSSSIDKSLIANLKDKKIVSYKIVRSALGVHKRPTIMLEVEFQGIKFHEKFTLSDRAHMKYKVLIGRDILKKEGFLINPNKNVGDEK